uniref:NADH-ubiquinone oxidoreductase chain 2 n=1 Tax=Leucophoroptera quadrimaculata TaxID=981277 RepID=A0A514LQJ9_9HEMI|nr:NADH dehydrogenase subunit 2 [Leucophoroptera quadrimaculata]
MKTSSKIMFFTMLITSTFMVMSASSWMTMWMGLEINLMSFIPLISTSKNLFLSQGVMMYFLVQSMSSLMFLLTILMYKYMFLYMNTYLNKIIITMLMMMKMGMPPFHFWFPEISNKLSWNSCMMLMTWQKMAPMYIMSLMMELNKIMSLMICLSALMGAIGGLNQTSTRKIMAYSSMNHLSWMTMCAMTFKKSWTLYLFMYFIMMISISWMMKMYNILYINQMNIFFEKNIDKIIMMMMMLSLGGIPPFLGFLPKWITIQYMVTSKEFITMVIMMMSALITLNYYLRITTNMNLMMSHSQKWMKSISTKKNMSVYMMITNLLFPLMILIMNFY